jgi:hypothetical protein
MYSVRMADGAIRVEFRTVKNRLYYVQRSTDLRQWQTVAFYAALVYTQRNGLRARLYAAAKAKG